MKLLLGLALLAVCSFAAGADQCEIAQPNIQLTNLLDTCKTAVINQVKQEMWASYKYFQMGAYFARDQVNLPGFSELFFKAAKEERDHSAILMSYLSTRLSDDSDIDAVKSGLFKSFEKVNLNGFSGKKALSDAYEMEKSITAKIKNIISECDKVDDRDSGKEYHVSDFLTGDFLTEQYESERSFGGKLLTLEKMWEHHGALAEYMFDKTL